MCSTPYAQTRVTSLDGVSSDSELTEEQKIRLRNYLEGLTDRRLRHTRNDYMNDKARGTVNFNREKGAIYIKDRVNNRIIKIGDNKTYKVRNYSFHRLDVEEGDIIGDYDNYINLRQENPDTVISNKMNLTFINADMTNVKVHDSWTLINCINEQSVVREEVENGKTYAIRYNRNKETNKFEEIERHEVFTE